MTDISGLRFCEPFAHYDPEQSCWRTSEATFPWGSDEFSETWPKRGSMRNGVCYERQMSAPPTAGPECSSLLATPMAHDRTFSPRKVDHGIQLANQVAALLPTPRAQMGEERNCNVWFRPDGQPQNLENAIARLLPTSTARDGDHTNPPSDGGNESSDVQLPFR